MKAAFQKFEKWSKETTNLTEGTINIGHPIYVADALATKAFISLLGLISKIALIEFEGIPDEQSSIQNDALSIFDVCDRAWKIYRQADMIEGEVRTQLIMAQAFEIMNQVESAKSLAEGVVSKANYLGYKRHVETAKEILSGKTLFFKNIQAVRNMLRHQETDGYDISILNTDEDIRHFAEFMMESYKIPNERRENVIIEALCMKDLTREKAQWCRHIEIHQNLTHTFSPLTLYAENPNRCIVCSKFDYLVEIGWRSSTVDIDIRLDPEPAGIFQAIAKIKQELNINIELASPQDFLPPLPGWRDRSIFIGRHGHISFYHYDFTAQALSKLSRGFDRDLKDVQAMYEQKLFSLEKLRESFEAIAPELIRFPSLNADVLRSRVGNFIKRFEGNSEERQL